MKIIAPAFLTLFILTACSSSTVKEKIQQVGDVAGQTAGEFAKGVGNGVTKSFEAQITLSEDLKNRGIQLGKTIISSDSIGTDNLLNVYIIFSKDFTGNVLSKVFDSKSLEMGRARVSVTGKAGDARFIDFHFDKRTNIDNNCKLIIQDLYENDHSEIHRPDLGNGAIN